MIEPRNYSLIAPLYDRIFARPLEEGHLLIGELLQSNPHKKILEVGIGSGLTLEHVDDQDFTGIDINEEMLYEAQVKALGRHNIHLLQMDAENLRFDNNEFDIVMAPSVLSAVSHPIKVFEEMIRVTRPGGKVVVISNFSDDKKMVSKIFDPLTRSLLGFRLDLELDYFKKHQKLKILQIKKINHFANISLSWYLEFEKQK
ncbi:MAG TPA: class I SAM-dependent methyltransferase [Bacteriovoracaceae bacterium]|nr:class I SAM-dependent methyltransferase [Bacteriovoracaceae bacterium]